MLQVAKLDAEPGRLQARLKEFNQKREKDKVSVCECSSAMQEGHMLVWTIVGLAARSKSTKSCKESKIGHYWNNTKLLKQRKRRRVQQRLRPVMQQHTAKATAAAAAANELVSK